MKQLVAICTCISVLSILICTVHLMSIVYLIMLGTQSLTGMLNIASNCPNIRSVRLRDCPLLMGSIYASLARACQKLRYIHFQGQAITDGDVRDMQYHCKELRTLYLNKTANISSETQRNIRKLVVPQVKLEIII